MSGTIVIGSQWGDEGKGKIIDAFSVKADYVVRYQGGANAGHTLNVSQKKIILHLIPSGILHSHVTCIIASGVVLDIMGLMSEIRNLKKLGYLLEDKQLLISESATLLLDYHKQLDQAREQNAGHQKIGTTGKGIGPAYEDRSSRKALTFSDLFLNDDELKEKLKKSCYEKLFILSHYYKQNTPSLQVLMDQLREARRFLKVYRCQDTSSVIHEALKQNKKVLFEGAQGTLLDLLHGAYPYVTSSSTLAGSALTGSGMGWKNIKKVMAITKAYTTRVGEGPFPSECDLKSGRHFVQRGKEKGATTQRTRRPGWLDLVALKYAIRINGITHLALMKLDVLTSLKSIKVCTAYLLNGKKITNYPIHHHELQKCQGIYEELDGWEEEINTSRSLQDLPENAKKYLKFIEDQIGLPIDMVSVGPGRDEIIWINSLF